MTSEPAHLGPYLLRRQLGEGGMGVVHLAEDPHGALVAVKELRPGVVAGEEGRARLAREVESLRRVRDPRVAEVLDADVLGLRPYVVTRYVAGRSLDRFVADHGKLSGRSQLRLARGLADALAVVHAAGVVHRDVKPGNVMLEESGGVVLIDFGLARALDGARLTTTGVLVGTPGYLAPEVVVGRPPTTATDVHGWAATVAFAASGDSPYGEGPPLAVVDRIRRGEHVLRDLEPTLEPLVRAALDEDPTRRPGLAQLRARLAEHDPAAAVTAAPAPASLEHSDVVPGEPVTALLALAPRTRVDLPAAPVAPLPRPAPLVAPSAAVSSAAPRAVEPVAPWPPGPLPAPATHSGSSVAVLPPWPGAALAEPPRPSGPAMGVLLASGAVFVATVAVAPFAALLLLGLALLTARTTERTRSSLLRRRLVRGPRPHDLRAAAAQAPLRAVLGTPATVLQLFGAALAGAATGGLTTVLVQRPSAPYYVAGAVAVAVGWWGPGGRRTRSGARTLLAPLSGQGRARAAWGMVAGLVLLAWGLVLVAEQYAVSWWPLAASPTLGR